MKKNYLKLKMVMALFAFGAVTMTAQLAGIYTINSAVPTGGANYQTFAAFRTALLVSGISGPVTVNVAVNSGPYNEQMDLPAIPGTSAINTITINGNGNTMSFAASAAAPWTIGYSGADYITFNNMNFIGTSSSAALVCHLWNNSDYNTFNNCTFSTDIFTASTLLIPVSVSGSATGGTTSGPLCGNFNVWSGCTMTGGYYGAVFYTSTSAPFNQGNRVVNSTLREFYYTGIYNYYHRDLVASGNIIERPTRTNSTTGAGIYLTTQSYNAIIESNKIRNLWGGYPGYTGTCYGIFCVGSVSGSITAIRNNVVSDMSNFPGSLYGIYMSTGNYTDVYHNTVSMDDVNNGGTGVTYGIYATGGGTQQTFRNNNVTILRGGGGTKYCLYLSTTLHVSNYNNLYINSPAGTNYVGYYNGAAHLTLAALIASGSNANGWSTDPFYAAPTNYNYMPTSNTLNNGGTPLGLTVDVDGNARSAATPDPGAYEFFNTPCFGLPSANSAITPTYIICPNSPVNVFLTTTYTVSGMSYQWQMSNLSPVGPWTVIPTGTNSALTATVGSVPLYYSATITCANGNQSISAVAGSVNVVGTTTNNVPYFEGFEGIIGTNKLPNCSWSASNLQSTCFTYTSSQLNLRIPRTGNKMASFYYSPAQNNYFWSNGIQLEPGITYSISTWYITDANGSTNWDLRLLINQNQNAVGAATVATTGGFAVAPIYKSLSNTFTVATSGLYYIGINGLCNIVSGSQYLTWDDLEVIIPCSLNSPTMSIVAGSQTLCAGQSIVLTANGADSYSWSDGSSTSAITVSPQIPTMYSVVGTNSTSSCSTTLTQMVNVLPSPQLSILAPVTSICVGNSLNLSGIGATTYTWSNGSNNSAISVSPSSSTTYSLLGSNSFGCTSSITQAIVVNQLPTVGISSSNANGVACDTDVTTLTGTGANTYQWASNFGVLTGNPINVTPGSTVTYTVYGTDANGCMNTFSYELSVTTCVGLATQTAVNSAIMVYPNPNNGKFSINWTSNDTKSAQVTDITGRVILSVNNVANHMDVDMTHFANGIYYVKLLSNANTEVIKVVKQ